MQTDLTTTFWADPPSTLPFERQLLNALVAALSLGGKGSPALPAYGALVTGAFTGEVLALDDDDLTLEHESALEEYVYPASTGLIVDSC
jgi:hypothetical protein